MLAADIAELIFLNLYNINEKIQVLGSIEYGFKIL